MPFDADEVRPGYRGATLAPWPNRIVDGRYVFGGVEHRLPVSEPERGQALHGLVAWSEFADRVVGPDRVVLATTIEPQAGYPFRIEVEVEYRLDADGLTQTVTGRNLGIPRAGASTRCSRLVAATCARRSPAENAGSSVHQTASVRSVV